MIAWPLDAAIKSGLFSEVMVSTDDEEIAEISRKLGATVPFLRSPETSSDIATTADVLTEVLTRYANAGKYFNSACCIYATAPFLTAEILKKTREVLVSSSFDAVIPVARFSYPIWRSLKREGSGRIELNWPEHLNSRSQDLQPAYHDVGQFYWFRPEAFLKTCVLMGSNTGSIVIPESQVQDIDTEEDWRIAEWKHERMFG